MQVQKEISHDMERNESHQDQAANLLACFRRMKVALEISYRRLVLGQPSRNLALLSGAKSIGHLWRLRTSLALPCAIVP